MPFADPDRQREYNRDLFRNRYQQDAEFREKEKFRKGKEHGWFGRTREETLARLEARRRPDQVLKPINELLKAGKFWHGAKLRAILLSCSQHKFPAKKVEDQWYSSLAAIRWFIWQSANEAARSYWREDYSVPRRPRFWRASHLVR
jgi:hypothetical protein